MYTYFIIENEGESDHRIKIGFSNAPKRRVKVLQTGNSRKLALMGWIKSDSKSLEKLLHNKFQTHNINGEWFSIEPWNVLQELKAHGTSAFICVQSNVGKFLGCDADAIPEYFGPWEWLDTEMQDFCPRCGWGGGLRYNEAVGDENCLKCGYPHL